MLIVHPQPLSSFTFLFGLKFPRKRCQNDRREFFCCCCWWWCFFHMWESMRTSLCSFWYVFMCLHFEWEHIQTVSSSKKKNLNAKMEESNRLLFHFSFILYLQPALCLILCSTYSAAHTWYIFQTMHTKYRMRVCACKGISEWKWSNPVHIAFLLLLINLVGLSLVVSTNIRVLTFVSLYRYNNRTADLFFLNTWINKWVMSRLEANKRHG